MKFLHNFSCLSAFDQITEDMSVATMANTNWEMELVADPSNMKLSLEEKSVIRDVFKRIGDSDPLDAGI